MPYFGRGGQFGGWLDNPAFGFNKGAATQSGRGATGGRFDWPGSNQDKSGRATSSGGVRNAGPRGDNTGYQRGDVRGYGGPSPEGSPDMSSGFGDYYQNSGGVDPTAGPGDGDGSGGDPSQQDRMDAMNAWMEELMGKGWRSKMGGADIEVPEKYEAEPRWTPEDAGIGEAQIDPMAVINAAKPGLLEQMNRGFASAAMKQGGTGALMGSGYSKALGGVARKASDDLNKITMDTLFKSSENAADREQRSRQNALDRSFDAWGTGSGRDQDAWQTHGDWEQNQGRWGRDMEMNMIQQLLSQFGGGFF